MKTKLLALLLLAGSSVFAGPRVAVGFGVGVGPAYGYYAAPPPPPAVYAAPAPVYPYAVGVRYGWGPRYWAHPAPRFYGGRAYAGHWRR
ncbi:MAG: hypothetical protein ABSB86_18375 [Bryobacteraceae bacterium]|jgi:hypothetical protein